MPPLHGKTGSNPHVPGCGLDVTGPAELQTGSCGCMVANEVGVALDAACGLSHLHHSSPKALL